MFSKLLRHDLKAILKYWWIAAATSPLVAFFCGVCINIVSSDRNYGALTVLAGLGGFLGVVGLGAFAVIAEVLILIRFYKNFFTDEGYLTFTLPVKRSHLLGSKVCSAVITLAVTAVILVFDTVIVYAAADPNYFFKYRWVKEILNFFKVAYSEIGGYLILFIAEVVLAIIVLAFFAVLSMFACINIAAMVAKKHKVLAAIGIYYLFSGALSLFVQFAFIRGGIVLAFEKLYMMPTMWGGYPVALPATAIMIFGGIAVAVLLTAALYLLELWLLHRKLNLE